MEFALTVLHLPNLCSFPMAANNLSPSELKDIAFTNPSTGISITKLEVLKLFSNFQSLIEPF
ncbi:unnamed protein product [Acanthoscelides obtectus]|uniref:Uncharacterized protein n=1 Tax=Acanthoscelides obtectus TaxID=200917 RepID=A0A9P0KB60_ACAOB|nr:unnamed protein product [Acanthoscelides obtectus]CAK1662375.1 hypothetical protein AOBTE_LOCUS23111 [Acanthoscelides obtectus]